MIVDPHSQATGMDIRTWLSGMAMQGLLGQHCSMETESGARDFEAVYTNIDTNRLIQRAFKLADAMITELNKQPST